MSLCKQYCPTNSAVKVPIKLAETKLDICQFHLRVLFNRLTKPREIGVDIVVKLLLLLPVIYAEGAWGSNPPIG